MFHGIFIDLHIFKNTNGTNRENNYTAACPCTALGC
jgi:hypothetical protein